MSKTKAKITTIVLAILMLLMSLCLSACGEKEETKITYPTTRAEVAQYLNNAVDKIYNANSFTVKLYITNFEPADEQTPIGDDQVSIYKNEGVLYYYWGNASSLTGAREVWYFKQDQNFVQRTKSDGSVTEQTNPALDKNLVDNGLLPLTNAYTANDIVMFYEINNTLIVHANYQSHDVIYLIYDGTILTIDFSETSYSSPDLDSYITWSQLRAEILYDTNPTIPDVPEVTE